ncbi:MFS transporter [Svornostia abyssi]|uniref:MFS transporter n=1 Tax=Svornostia abyssi TaxID=2898438 RepID=A0ABY5PJW2_9ACTN|nr:MFS transporter [Parviterribacteraceae bacterium J379]
MLAALAQSAEQLIAARVLLGAGGAMIMPSTVTLLRTVFLDDRERAIAVGVWSAVAAGGFAIGPVIGGALLEIADWPWLFALQAPFVILAIVAVLALVPEWRSPDPGPWDPIGVGLSIVGMVTLVWGIKEASKHGFGEVEALASLTLGAVALIAFVRRQRRLTHPLLDVELFRDRRFSVSALSVLGVFFGFGGLLLLLTQFLQIVQGLGPLEAGLRLLPMAVAAGIASPCTDAAVRRVGAHVVVGGGFAIVAGAFAVLSGLDADTPYWVIGACLATLGVGAGMASTAASAVILSSAPPERAGGAVAVQETAYELGGALGVATLGSVMTARYRAELDGVAAIPAEAGDSLPAAAEVAAGVGGTAGGRGARGGRAGVPRRPRGDARRRRGGHRGDRGRGVRPDAPRPRARADGGLTTQGRPRRGVQHREPPRRNRRGVPDLARAHHDLELVDGHRPLVQQPLLLGLGLRITGDQVEGEERVAPLVAHADREREATQREQPPGDEPRLLQQLLPRDRLAGGVGHLVQRTLRELPRVAPDGVAPLPHEVQPLAVERHHERGLRLLDHRIHPGATSRPLDRVLAHPHPRVLVDDLRRQPADRRHARWWVPRRGGSAVRASVDARRCGASRNSASGTSRIATRRLAPRGACGRTGASRNPPSTRAGCAARGAPRSSGCRARRPRPGRPVASARR